MLTKSHVSGFTLVPVLFVLTLFLLLSFLAVSVIMAGSSVYEKISDNMDANYDRRVTFSYLTTKIRQNDVGGSIYVEEKDGASMTAVKEDGELSFIYFYKNYMRKITPETGTGGVPKNFSLHEGGEIIKAQSLSFDLINGGSELEITVKNPNGNFYGETIGGLSVLAESEIIDASYFDEDTGDYFDTEEEYITYVYLYGGYLRKFIMPAGGDFAPENGWILMKAKDFYFDAVTGQTFITVESDADGKIYLEEKPGVKMIALRESMAGYGLNEEYVTYIYYFDGYLREIRLEVINGNPLDFEFDWGDEIIQAEGFEFVFGGDDGKIKLILTDREGNEQSTIVTLRSQMGRQEEYNINNTEEIDFGEVEFGE